MTFLPDTIAHTRHGHMVKILAVLPEGQDDVHGYAVVGLVTDKHDQSREIMTWARNGKFNTLRGHAGPSSLDLVQPPQIVSISPKLEAAE